MVNDNLELKISLEELRNTINLEKDEWLNIEDNNCYAYALGIDLPLDEIKEHAFLPGSIANCDLSLYFKKKFTYEYLLNNMYLDFKELGIEFREINPLDEVNIGEWKIALFVTYEHSGSECVYLTDFHFLRQRRDGFWYHKDGFCGEVCRIDSYRHEITNPEQCRFVRRTYKKCLSLKKKNNNYC